MLKRGSLRAEKVQYKDGIGCCVWYPILIMDDVEDRINEQVGLCFDFSHDDIDDLIALLTELKGAEAELFEELD